MTEDELLAKMVAPAGPRPSKPYLGGVIQICVTRACNLSCFSCTQGSNLAGKVEFMSPRHFEQAVRSLGFEEGLTGPIPRPSAYWGVVGVFGGNPALSPHFSDYCRILRQYVPFVQRGLWCNNPVTLDKAQEMARTFNPAYSNLNVHLDAQAYQLFKQGWPAAHVVGLTEDSRHSPPFVAMRDVVTTVCDNCGGAGGYFDLPNGERHLSDPGGIPDVERLYSRCPECEGVGKVPDVDRIRELISTCDINQHWSAMIGVFRGELRAWFCEVAGAQAMLHQHEPDYPDTGLDPRLNWSVEPFTGDLLCGPPHGEFGRQASPWWRLPMQAFAKQVRKHCFECGVPLRGYGQLSQGTGFEQTSATHEAIYRPKRKDREVQLVTDLVQLDVGRISKVNHYLQNSKV